MKKAFIYLLFMLLPGLVFCQKPATTLSQKQFDQLQKDLQSMQEQLQNQLKSLQESISFLSRQLKERDFNIPGSKFHARILPDGRSYLFSPDDQADEGNFFIPKREDLEKWKDAIKDFEIPQWDLRQWKEESPDFFRVPPPNHHYDFNIPKIFPPPPPPAQEFKRHRRGSDDWKHGLPFYDWFNKS
ncbi:MAG: hypothetical protein H0W62_07480 [Chitinophagales bacterium]|nr:hypothetical protein [Chitinophagales bacterium]